MAKVGHILVSGLAWVAIAGAVGLFAVTLTDNGGLWSAIGWTVAIASFGFAGLSAREVWRTVSAQRHVLRTMQDDPEMLRAMQERYATVVQRTEQGTSQVPLVFRDEFVRSTLGGRPNQMNMSPYTGHSFSCACGDKHSFDSTTVQVLRELAGARLVLSCPNDRGVTCVKVDGILRFKGFVSLFGMRTEPGAA